MRIEQPNPQVREALESEPHARQLDQKSRSAQQVATELAPQPILLYAARPPPRRALAVFVACVCVCVWTSYCSRISLRCRRLLLQGAGGVGWRLAVLFPNVLPKPVARLEQRPSIT